MLSRVASELLYPESGRFADFGQSRFAIKKDHGLSQEFTLSS